MDDKHDRIDQLEARIRILLDRQEEFVREVSALRNEIQLLKGSQPKVDGPVRNTTVPEPPKITEQPAVVIPPQQKQPKTKSDLERFIGENLINKIGIVITIIGVAIGAKYSIDHNLINPLTRMIIGYLFAVALLGVGIRLKAKYFNYSAVLVGGAIAIMYFLTFAAFSFYELIPKGVTFGMMVIFTIFSIIAALSYSLQVIALIGLVGAYGVPFLLSDGTGKVEALFTYIAIINAGVLVIAFRKYWKLLFFAAFGLTWIIYLSWFVTKYDHDTQFGFSSLFLVIFFVSFYITFLAYKLLRKEKFAPGDIVSLLTNSFVFFGLGYSILSYHEVGRQLLGLFTLSNAVIHTIVSYIIYRQKLGDKNLVYLIAGLVLVFATMAVPVQLDGNWVTLFWAGEAVLLFWMGKSKGIRLYENLSYPLMILAFISLAHDWSEAYNAYYPAESATRITPVLNVHFLTNLLFVAAFAFINYVNSKKTNEETKIITKAITRVVSVMVPFILIFTAYNMFRMEIEMYWDQLFTDSSLEFGNDEEGYQYYSNYDLLKFKSIWILNYSLVFASILAWINLKFIQNRTLSLVSLGLILLAIWFSLTKGLLDLSELRESYLTNENGEYYQKSSFSLNIRYISITLLALPLYVSYLYIRNVFTSREFKVGFDLLLHSTILWVLSSELLNLTDIYTEDQSYKLGLSILWGVYSVFLIVLGIIQKKKLVRFGAIGLFGVTLLKLFFYDISHLDTIAKTIVFVSLGVLLLIISFLYNKYKHLIAGNDEV